VTRIAITSIRANIPESPFRELRVACTGRPVNKLPWPDLQRHCYGTPMSTLAASLSRRERSALRAVYLFRPQFGSEFHQILFVGMSVAEVEKFV